ncbi:hypothetical protein BD410DRAFT_510432 [Rickenella mellea]|uniref:F-box domain-containing protein n=1 Tax=Rickenella mellea TaxID=50990 RepID=A0A4Y7PU97_9AGAM|nr:hypothetical protein BD410DRAFT_510432 [Rickenella mellea]
MDHIANNKRQVQLPEKDSATIQRLLPELLSEIFLHCLPYPEDYQYSIRNLSQAPLFLGRVCSRWRNVSISSPKLWSSFTIGEDDSMPVFYSKEDMDVACKKDFEATRLWISRSGSVPLSIQMYYPRSYSSAATVQKILRSVVSQSWRWKQVVIHTLSEFQNIILAPFRTGPLPQLLVFDSTISGDSSLGTSTDLVVLSSALRLQKLRISGGSVHIDFGDGENDIKNLDIGSSVDSRDSLAYLTTIFDHCPSLTHLTISVMESETSFPPIPPAIIEFSCLSHLSVSARKDPGPLFDQLFLPALISLQLSMDIDDAVFFDDWPHLCSMLARSRPHLQCLRLVGVPMTQETIAECLSYAPHLIALSISGTFCADDILEHLTLDKIKPYASENLCLSLNSIEFGDGAHFSSSAMITMILSRRPSASEYSDIGTESERMFIWSDMRIFDRGDVTTNPDIAECLNDGWLQIHGLD